MDHGDRLLNQHDCNFLEKLIVPACFLDSGLGVLSANTGFLNLFNLKREDVAHKNLDDFFMLSSRGRQTEILKFLNNGSLSGNQPGLLVRQPKEKTPCKATLFLQRYNAGKQVHLLQVTDLMAVKNNNRPDVTDQHLFRLLLDEVPDAIYFKDTEGRFFLTNRLHSNKRGLKNVVDFMGKTDFDLFSEEHARQAFEDEQDVIRTGKTLSKEEKETHFDGSETWASTSKMPLKNEHGKIVGTFGISKDITQIKNAELQLRKAEKILQEANASKDKFFSILAHDLKNPFNSLMGMSELMVEEFGVLSDKEKLQMLRQINQTSESAYALLENLLDWSRVQTGSISVFQEDLLLKKILDEVIDLSRLHAFSKDISIQKSVPEHTIVFADENMLRTIIRNLLSNAIKFTPKGGEIILAAHTEANRVQISIQDNGLGMDAETVDKLFKISEKVKTYGTADESGTGLGLIIVREFVKENSGSVSVQSTPGKGTTFTVTLPAGAVQAGSSKGAQASMK